MVGDNVSVANHHYREYHKMLKAKGKQTAAASTKYATRSHPIKVGLRWNVGGGWGLDGGSIQQKANKYRL